MSKKTFRIGIGAAALTLLPGLLLAEPRPDDRDGDRRGRRATRTERVEPCARTAAPRPRGRRVETRSHTRRIPRRAHRHVPPRRVHHRHAHRARCTCVTRVIPGHYVTRYETVRVPGHYERVRVPGPRVRFGRHVEVGICEPRYERVWVPATVRKVPRRVWVPARTVVVRTCGRCLPGPRGPLARRH